MRSLVLSLPLLLAMASPASAIATYEYTGNLFTSVFDAAPPAGAYTTSMRVTGTLTFDEPIAPSTALTSVVGDLLSFSFTDGRNTLTDANTDSVVVQVGTDAAGNIDGWVVLLATAAPVVQGDQERQVRTSNDTVTFPFPLVGDEGRRSECVDPSCTQIQNDQAFSSDNPGTWTLTVVPEPGTGLLLGLSLASVLALRGGKREGRPVG